MTEKMAVDKKRPSPTKLVEGETKKARADSPMKNDASSFSSLPAAAPVQDVKKIGISEDEKQMNGAPEGDLYDVVLLENGQLFPFSSSEQAEQEFLRNLGLYNETTIWAEKYECITIFRRMVLYHEAILAGCNNKSNHNALLNCLVDGIQSLRSSNVRNSLLCIKQYSMTKLDANSTDGIWNLEGFGNLVTVLLNRLGSGPKFLCDATFDATNTLFENCPPKYSFELLTNFVNHRNIDTSWKSIQLLVLAFRQITKAAWEEFLAASTNNDLAWMKTGLNLLFLALSSKKPQGKEKAKESWQQLQTMLGADTLSKLLETTLNTTQTNEILRELQKVSTISSVSSTGGKAVDMKAARVPLRAALASEGTSQKQRIPFGALKSSLKAASTQNEVAVDDAVVVVQKPWLKKSAQPQQLQENDENKQNMENLSHKNKPAFGVNTSPKGKTNVGHPVKLVVVSPAPVSKGPYDFMLY